MAQIFEVLSEKSPKVLGKLIDESGTKPWEVRDCPYCGSTDIIIETRTGVNRKTGKPKTYSHYSCGNCGERLS